MWPMLAAIGPLLGNGIYGHFLGGADDNIMPWGYEDGSFVAGKYPTKLVEKPYRLAKPNPPIAVLTGDHTSSSGEAAYIAFRGRSNVKSFGAATDGRTTSNHGIVLEDVSGPGFVLPCSSWPIVFKILTDRK